MCLKQILSEYEKASGQRINYDKSCISFSKNMHMIMQVAKVRRGTVLAEANEVVIDVFLFVLCHFTIRNIWVVIERLVKLGKFSKRETFPLKTLPIYGNFFGYP